MNNQPLFFTANKSIKKQIILLLILIVRLIYFTHLDL